MRMFNTAPIGAYSLVFKQVEEQLKQAFLGKTNEFLHNIDYYLNLDLSAKLQIANRGKSTISSLHQNNGWKGSASDLIDPITDDYAAIFQVLEDYVVVGISTETEGYPTALYTRDVKTLSLLATQGSIDHETLEKVGSALGYANEASGTKTQKSIKEGNFVAVRLDFTGFVNGTPQFKAVIPKSNLNIGLGKDFVIIPVPFMYMFEYMLNSAYAQTPFLFTKTSFVGQEATSIQHYATINPQIVMQAYAQSPQESVQSKLAKTAVGYNVLKQRFYAYDLESSLYGIGSATFRPEMLDSIVRVNLQDVDTSYHNIDFTVLRSIFRTRIKGLKVAQLDALPFINLEGYATVGDKQEAVFAFSDKESNKNLYFLMKSNEEIFGNIEESIATRERMTPRYLKNFSLVDLPLMEQDRVELLTKLLETGVVRFTAFSKSGSTFERTISNNKTVLEKVFGKEYVKNYESIRNKLYHVLDMFKNNEVKNTTKAEELLVQYNLADYIDTAKFLSGTEGAIATISDAIEVLKQKAANRKIAEGAVIYRDLSANEAKNFFGNINVNNIATLEFSPLPAK